MGKIDLKFQYEKSDPHLLVWEDMKVKGPVKKVPPQAAKFRVLSRKVRSTNWELAFSQFKV